MSSLENYENEYEDFQVANNINETLRFNELCNNIIETVKLNCKLIKINMVKS